MNSETFGQSLYRSTQRCRIALAIRVENEGVWMKFRELADDVVFSRCM